VTRDEVMELAGMLEWSQVDVQTCEEEKCPYCGAPEWPDRKHYPTCRLARLLREGITDEE
jgi:hypothetical protein